MGKRILIFLGVLVALAACKDTMFDNSPDGPLILSQQKVTVGKAATEVNLGVNARDGSWSVTGAPDWFELDADGGAQGISTLVISFTENAGPDEETPADTRTATLTFTSAGTTLSLEVEQLGTDFTPPVQSPDYDLNKAIHEELLNVWYYNGETNTVPADYNQTYQNFYRGYLSTLTRNTLDGKTWAANNERYLYSHIERLPLGTPESGEIPLNYGMEFDLGSYGTYNVVARIQYVLPGSPAEAAGLKRGDWFYKVNDRVLQNYKMNNGWLQYNRYIDSLVNPVEGVSPKLGMLRFESYALRLVDDGNSVTLTPARFKGNPILRTQLIGRYNVNSADSVYAGYVALQSLDEEYRQELIEAFDNLRAEAEQRIDTTDGADSISTMILDLRYSKTGTVEMAELLGNLVVPAEAAGETFAQYVFAQGEATANNRITSFAPHESGVGVPQVIILTSRSTAGASELLINALRGIEPILKLIVVGEKTTEGMNVGMVRRRYITEEWEYDVWMTAFRCYNAQGNPSGGNYEYGFTPNGGSIDLWGDGVRWSDTWGWKGGPGVIEDPLLEKAMQFVAGQIILPSNPVATTAAGRKEGFTRQFCVPAGMTMADREEGR